MNVEQKIMEALHAEAEDIDLPFGLWSQIQERLEAKHSIHLNGYQEPERSISTQPRVKRVALASFLAVLVVAVLLAVPATRSALAQWLGVSFEQQASPYGIVQQALAYQPLSETGSYEYQIYELRRDRWSITQDFGLRLPQQGEQIALPNGDLLCVPSYLPAGFEWQDVVVANQSVHGLGFPGLLAPTWGGGGGEPGEPMPSYDRSFVTFLVGGNPSNQFLLLTQMRNSTETGLSIRFFYVLSPDREPEFGQSSATVPAGVTPTPAPVPQAFEAKLLVGVIVTPDVNDGITVTVGSLELNETMVGQQQGWWYNGTWNADGEWDNSDVLTNLIWERGNHIYQLTGEGISLDELIRIAESVP